MVSLFWNENVFIFSFTTSFQHFVFSQNGYLKFGFVIWSTGMPSLDFLVVFIVLVEQWPRRWSHNYKSFIFCENVDIDGGRASGFVPSPGDVGSVSKSWWAIVSTVLSLSSNKFVLLLTTWSKPVLAVGYIMIFVVVSYWLHPFLFEWRHCIILDCLKLFQTIDSSCVKSIFGSLPCLHCFTFNAFESDFIMVIGITNVIKWKMFG